MVFGGVDHERLQLNEDTLWSGGRYDPVNPDALAAFPEIRRLVFAGRLQEAQALANAKLMAKPLSQTSYQTLGVLFISLPTITADSVRDYERAPDLDTAVATTGFAAGTVRHERSAFACLVRQVIAVRLFASKVDFLDCDMLLRSPQSGTLTIADDTLILSGRNAASEKGAGALRFEAWARVLHEVGTVESRAGEIGVRGARTVTVLIAMATSYRDLNDVGGDPAALTRRHIEAAAAVGFDRIAATAAAEHWRLCGNVRIDLGRTAAADQPTDERIRLSETSDDPALAALYFNDGRYLLMASSRAGSQPDGPDRLRLRLPKMSVELPRATLFR